MARQYVGVRFNPWDRRSYTYHNDGAPVRVGDQVVVNTPNEGPKQVPVVAVLTEPPEFQTKPIEHIAERSAT